MSFDLEKHISTYFEKVEKLSKQLLVQSIKKDFPNWAENTINMYLSNLKKKGIINTPSRGIYELPNKIPFEPKISVDLIEIFKAIKRKFPYITFCIWNNVWLNDFMRHQPFKNYIIIEVEKDACESVFGYLNEIKKNVFLNPNEEIFDRYIQNLDEAIIVKNLVSEAPLIIVQKITVPALEKILVDMLIETNLFSAQQNEKEFILKSSMDKFTINKLKMRRYAIRRNREPEINKLLNIISAK